MGSETEKTGIAFRYGCKFGTDLEQRLNTVWQDWCVPGNDRKKTTEYCIRTMMTRFIPAGAQNLINKPSKA